MGVNLNGEESSFFKPGKGLRQGDPISPLLFNLVGDVLTRMLSKVVENNLIGGLLTDLRMGELCHSNMLMIQSSFQIVMGPILETSSVV